MSEETAVEIWFPVVPDEQQYPASQPWEQLHAWPTGDGAYVVDNIPFFVKDIAVGDIVSALMTSNGRYQFDGVRSRSGHSVFRLWLAAAMVPSASDIAAQLRALGCKTEITLGRLIAIDVPPQVEPAAWQVLEDGKARGDWDVQVGYSAE